MKKLILPVAFLCGVLTVSAQNDNNVYKPVKADWGFAFNLNGLINNIGLNSMSDVNGNQFFLVRNMLEDDLAFRAGFGFTSRSDKWSTVDSVFTSGPTLVSWDSSYSRVDLYFAPGLEKHFMNNSKLDPYIGAELKIGLLGKTKTRSLTVTADTSAKDITVEIKQEMTGGASLGVNLIAGFNFFFTDRLAIGAEYSWGFSSSRIGGDWSRITTVTDLVAATTTKTQGSDVTSNTGFAVGSTAGITLSYFFTRNKKEKKEKKEKEEVKE